MINDSLTETKRYRYTVISDIYTDDEGNDVPVYGIAAISQSDDTYAEAYHTLSADEDEVRELAKLCNSGELDLLHLKDVVEDFVV